MANFCNMIGSELIEHGYPVKIGWGSRAFCMMWESGFYFTKKDSRGLDCGRVDFGIEFVRRKRYSIRGKKKMPELRALTGKFEGEARSEES